jgi:protein TonB
LYATRAIASAEEPMEDAAHIVEFVAPMEVPPPPEEQQSAPQPEVPDEVFGHQVLAVPEFVPPEIPPPSALAPRIDPRDFSGEGREGGRGGAPREAGSGTGNGTISPDEAPRFMIMEVRPRILNPDEVIRMLERTYPSLLRDAGVGGDVTVWFFIDAEGRVLRRQIDSTSGYDAFDAAALKVADIMRFAPAENRGVKVPVWVSLPIRFQAR